MLRPIIRPAPATDGRLPILVVRRALGVVPAAPPAPPIAAPTPGGGRGRRPWLAPLLAAAVLLALALVLVPPGLMAALLIVRMVRHRDSGESIDCAHGER
jgi:hypothetical protein